MTTGRLCLRQSVLIADVSISGVGCIIVGALYNHVLKTTAMEDIFRMKK